MADQYGPWIGWNGGECPVEPNATVQVVRAWEGVSPPGNRIAGAQRWDATEGSAAIIAYRVKREPRVETVRQEAYAQILPETPAVYFYAAPNRKMAHGFLVYETRDGIPDMTTLRWEEAE